MLGTVISTVLFTKKHTTIISLIALLSFASFVAMDGGDVARSKKM